MKGYRVELLLTLLLLGGGSLNVVAVNVQEDASVRAFWTKFKAAVTTHDANSVAAMSQFPIEMPYGVPAIRTRAQLLKRYRALFNSQTDAIKCFAQARPEVDPTNKNAFIVPCKDAAGSEVVQYGFVRVRGVWKLSYLDNIAE
jgi:hypothetical protein